MSDRDPLLTIVIGMGDQLAPEPILTPQDLIRGALSRRKPVRPAKKDRSTIKAARKQKRRKP